MSFGKELVRALAGEIEDDYKARLDAAEKRSGELAADLIEERAQRRQAIAERDEARDEVVRLGRNLEGVQKMLDLAENGPTGDGVAADVALLVQQRNDERLHGALLLGEIERVQMVVGGLDAAALVTQQVGVRVDIEQPRRSEKVGDVMTHLAEITARRASEVWHGWTPVVRDVINWHGPWRELGAAEAAEPPEGSIND